MITLIRVVGTGVGCLKVQSFRNHHDGKSWSFTRAAAYRSYYKIVNLKKTF